MPGVGKKTAERLLVELEDRLSVPVLDAVGRRPAAAASAVGDVREALAGLGYGAEEIREALRELPADDDAPTLLRDALEAAGGAPCVTSSSSPAPTTDVEEVDRGRAAAPARSPSSSASAS